MKSFLDPKFFTFFILLLKCISQFPLLQSLITSSFPVPQSIVIVLYSVYLFVSSSSFLLVCHYLVILFPLTNLSCRMKAELLGTECLCFIICPCYLFSLIFHSSFHCAPSCPVTILCASMTVSHFFVFTCAFLAYFGTHLIPVLLVEILPGLNLSLPLNVVQFPLGINLFLCAAFVLYLFVTIYVPDDTLESFESKDSCLQLTIFLRVMQ